MHRFFFYFIGVLFFSAMIISAPPLSAGATDFRVLFVGQQTQDGHDCIAVTFSSPVDATRDINRFLKLFSTETGEVDGAWVLTDRATIAYFVNIEADTAYEVNLRQGLQAADGRTLAQTSTHTVRTRKAQAFISFGSKGYVLPSKLARGIPVSTMNVVAADVDFFKVKEKYLVDFLALFSDHRRIDYYYSDKIQRYADLVYGGRFEFDISRNVLAQAVLPISGIKPLNEPGVYLAVLRKSGDYEYDYPATYFSISDIGIQLRVYADTMTVQAQYLSSAKVCEGVKLTFYNHKGGILEQGRTDGQGSAAFANIKNKARLLVAERDRHTTIVPLNMPALDLSAFDLGEQPFRDLELFVYGPRDLYRPGETMIMDALLRDYDGRLLDHTPPISVAFVQPDGRRVKSFTWHGESLNAYHAAYQVPASAQTGTWTVEFKLAGKLIQLYKFKVEDFMPERMKLMLDNGNTDISPIEPDDVIALAVQGEYLYGAPAAGNRVDCNVGMALQREPVPSLPGFQFGDIDEQVPNGFTSEAITLDDQGRGVVAVDEQYAGIKSPMMIRLHVNLYESGGRPVSRNKVYHVWPADQLIGLRPLWEGEKPANDSSVEFEVVKTDIGGTLHGARDLSVTLIREYPDYYWEFSSSTGWQRRVNYQHYPVIESQLAIKAGKKALLRFPVRWGPYRLEVADPDTGLKTSHRFAVGWHWWGRDSDGGLGNRPDQVVLSLDQKAYGPGDAAKLLIKAPEAGTALVTVEGGSPLWRTKVDVETTGTEILIPIDAGWDRHDLHVSVMVVRPGDRRRKIAPKRAMGIVALPIDRSDRHLAVSVDVLEKVLPNSPLKVDVSVTGPTAYRGDVYVTLAAVDVGVLSITGFKTPDPAGYFFNRRRYEVDYFDVYQKIIESHEGQMASQRFGGDGVEPMVRGGEKPVTDVQIVSLYKERVRPDEAGKAAFTLDLPDFNGRLRLMAVAYDDRCYGAGEKEVTVAAPVVAEIAMPRFLSMGDASYLALDIQNLSGMDQDLTLALKTSDPIELTSVGTHKIKLPDKAKTTVRFAVQAGYSVGSGAIDLEISGIQPEPGAEPWTLKRQWRLGTRPAYPAVTRQWRKALEPGQTLAVKASELEGLLPETIAGALTLTDRPPINVAGYVNALYAFPYGCLEQTTSGIFPQVLMDEDIFRQLKLDTQNADVRREKVQSGIDRLLTLQKPHGGFGLWSGNSPEECWLTAYVCDFLISARERGYDVPPPVLDKALERLNTYSRRPAVILARYTSDAAHTRLAVQAYAGFVLARLNRASLGTLRTIFDNHTEKCRTSLPMVHLGLALQLQGDNKRASNAFARALSDNCNVYDYYGEYGSPVRDAAMNYYLLTTYAPQYDRTYDWLIKLDEALHDRRWLSTQEKNALVLAGMLLLNPGGHPWQAVVSVDGIEEKMASKKIRQFNYRFDSLSHGLRIQAAGDRTVFVEFLLNGYPRQAPAAENHAITIHRTYYDMKGSPLAPKHLKAGVQSGDMVLVRLDVAVEKRVADALVVDLLPAGFELENQNLPAAFKIDGLEVKGKTIGQWKETLRLAHEEFRDDRYVAAVDIDQWQSAVLFYLVRVVSPGEFQVPNAYAEDMYRPYIRAIGDPMPFVKVVQPKESR